MDKQIPFYNPEIWGGIECTINRIADTYIDQLHLSGHYYREGDVEQICSLGIKKLRYPVLWEKHQPALNSVTDWSWTSLQLDKIRNRNIDVIAGLVHHGSGPSFTDLSDKNFPYLLAAYARQVAERFPWITYYTPVNEPLTTARFSGLYGIWYPHAKDPAVFIKMLLNELKGIILSMQEIRKINPSAQLVQTEDLGKTYSTKKLQYQADFENERRWLTYDILCGKFNKQHALWNYFMEMGIDEKELKFFSDHPCVPDIFGFNHYLTSERYLDENADAYPTATHGGNGKHSYADVEAIRVEADEPSGLEVLLKEAWNRYQKPMAITEVHLHCHREEQLRWLKYVWDTGVRLQSEGVEIKGVTPWALLGSYGWNQLLTVPDGTYEPGAFDLRSGKPRPTALAHYISDIANHHQAHHHLSEEKGWWQRSDRLLYSACTDTMQMPLHMNCPVLIIGRNGTLGRAFARICQDRCIPFHLLGRQDCDISKLTSIEENISLYKPWAIINAAGYVRVDEAENDKDACIRDNTDGPVHLALACKKHGIKLVNFSSDLVFDGNKPTPYIESDLPNPLNVYGRSKAQAELLVQKELPGALIIRTSAFFGPWDEYNFVHHVHRALSQYETIPVAKDLHISPTYVPHLVNATLDILIDKEGGIWHLTNKGSLTWYEWALLIASQFDLDPALILPVHADKLHYQAKRPFYSVLGSEKGQMLPSFELAMQEFYRHRKFDDRKVA